MRINRILKRASAVAPVALWPQYSSFFGKSILVEF
jgi:hypothetical protein